MEERGLAGPGPAHDADLLCRPGMEGDLVQGEGEVGAVPVGHAPHRQHALARPVVRSGSARPRPRLTLHSAAVAPHPLQSGAGERVVHRLFVAYPP